VVNNGNPAIKLRDQSALACANRVTKVPGLDLFCALARKTEIAQLKLRS
jgi:hypothetical protein